MKKSLYELIDIKIDGVIGHARPVEFELDNEQQPILIKKIVTTCPKCSSLNSYDVNIKDNSLVIDLKCTTCNPKDDVQEAKEAKEEKAKAAIIKAKNSKSDFVDPIELGIFNVEQV